MSAEQFAAALPDGTPVTVYLSAGCLQVLDGRGRTVLIAQRAAIEQYRDEFAAVLADLLGARPREWRRRPGGRRWVRGLVETPALPGAGRAPTTAGCGRVGDGEA
jgi:hypothetical protein